MTTPLTLSQAAAVILANNGRATDEIARVNIDGKRIWTFDGRAEHGCKGQRGYEVAGVLYAKAGDIVSHADRALAPDDEADMWHDLNAREERTMATTTETDRTTATWFTGRDSIRDARTLNGILRAMRHRMELNAVALPRGHDDAERYFRLRNAIDLAVKKVDDDCNG